MMIIMMMMIMNYDMEQLVAMMLIHLIACLTNSTFIIATLTVIQ